MSFRRRGGDEDIGDACPPQLVESASEDRRGEALEDGGEGVPEARNAWPDKVLQSWVQSELQVLCGPGGERDACRGEDLQRNVEFENSVAAAQAGLGDVPGMSVSGAGAGAAGIATIFF
jgi:hypothetical protein